MPKKKKFDIPHGLVVKACDDMEARVAFVTLANSYLRNYVKWNSRKWSLATHPFIEDFTSDFMMSMWKNPNRWTKSKNPIGHILFFFKYEAWSKLVWGRKYASKIELAEESLDEIDVMEWYSRDDSISTIDLFIDIGIHLATIKKPAYISDSDWRDVLGEVKEYFKILKDDEYGARECKLGAFAEELVYYLSGTLLAKRSNKYVR